MPSVEGHITIVQEQRFCLITETGQGYLLTLDHHAHFSATELHRYARERILALVKYSGEPTLSTGVAHAIYPVRKRPAKLSEQF